MDPDTTKICAMDSPIAKIESLITQDLAGKLTPKHGREISHLLSRYSKFRTGEIGVEDLLFDSEVVMDRAWELLNMGKWADVPVEFRQVYGLASLIHVVALLKENKEGAIEKSLEKIDMGILLGHPFEGISLTDVAEMLSSRLPDTAAFMTMTRSSSQNADNNEAPCKKLKLRNEVESRHRPSLELFYNNYFKIKNPVKLTGCIDHWPALKLWPNLDYIMAKAGHRTVPIEIGKHYADISYRQKLMKVSDFIECFFKEDAEDIGYLAQHQLFDQIPELKRDFIKPDYCAVSDECESSSETDVNAWFGPKGTVSPLHFDPKHNLLCQVVGTKKIILYPETDSEFLYPQEGMFYNTSPVDVENPDLVSFPNFKKAVERECLLSPGEILYIPPKYWHHVRALENSFSVSFWWE